MFILPPRKKWATDKTDKATTGRRRKSATRDILAALEELAMPAFRLVAILSAVLFSGAALYINLVEHPARMECGTSLAATVFGPSYRRATVMQVILALMATIGGAGAWLTGAPSLWLLGALFIFAVIPFTLIVIRPTNRQLLDTFTERTAEATYRLLQKWGRLHAVRSVLSDLDLGCDKTAPAQQPAKGWALWYN